MVFKKRFRKRRYKPKQQTLAMKAWKGVQKMQKAIEIKKLDSATLTAIPNSWLTFHHFTAIAAGDAINQRDGYKVALRSLSGSYSLIKNASATNTLVRIVIIRDNQQIQDALTLNGLDVFEYGAVITPMEKDNVGRFTKLFDKTYILTVDRPVIVDKFYVKSNKNVRYNGNNTFDITSNGHYMLAISDEPTNTPALDWVARTSFTDN